MSKYSTNEYVKIFDKLPLEIKDVVSSSTTTDHLINIGKKHNLQIDQIGALNSITLDVMMGIVATKNFVTEVVNELKITPLEASSLIRDVDEEMLKPIKKILIDLYADGAPNRPSSSLVQYYEEDENHPSLDKDAILSEIEKPVESPVKKEVVSPSLKVPAFSLKGNTNNENEALRKNNTHQTKELEIYHEELKNENKVSDKTVLFQSLPKVDENIPQSPTTPKISNPAASDLLNKIAGMKLNKTFVMPKGGDAAQLKSLEVSARLSSPDGSADGGQGSSLEGNKIEGIQINTLNQATNNTNLNVKPETPKPAANIDPYREKI